MTNLYELLKDAPDGLVMYSRAHGQVRVYNRGIECNNAFRLEPNIPFGRTIGYLDKYGRILPGGECMLFPTSKATDWDNWEDYLMIQSPCIGRIIYCEEEDELYQISGKNTVRNTQGHVKLAPSFKGCRFANEYEREQFYQLTKQSVMNQLLKQTKPGDLVLVRKQWSRTDKVWRLGHFSHICKQFGEDAEDEDLLALGCRYEHFAGEGDELVVLVSRHKAVYYHTSSSKNSLSIISTSKAIAAVAAR